MSLGFTENISAKKLGLLVSIEEKDINSLNNLWKTTNIADLASLFSSLENVQLAWVIKSISIETFAEVFPLLNYEKIQYVVRFLTKQELSNLFHEIAKDDAVDIIEEQQINEFRKILSSLKNEDRIQINKLLQYDEEVVGSIMSVDFIDLNENLSVKEATEYLKDKYKDAEEVRYYYVINNQHELVGFVDVQTIFFSKKEIKLKNIMNKNVTYVNSLDLIDKAINYFKKYDVPTLPVVSKAKELIGVITYDDLIDVVEDEATEDIEKQAGITPTLLSYNLNTTFKISTSRIFWLIILLLSSTLSQIVLTAFQGQINDMLSFRITALLVSLVPVISGTAGNAGSQAATSIVRSLALKELNQKMYWKTVFKELNISLYVGFILAVVNSIRMIIFYAIENGTINYFDLILTLTTSFCLMIAITLAKFTGASLPFLALILKKDPATMATPLLTTLIDAITTTIFFSISLGILGLIV